MLTFFRFNFDVDIDVDIFQVGFWRCHLSRRILMLRLKIICKGWCWHISRLMLTSFKVEWEVKSSNPRHRTTVKEGEGWVSNFKLWQPSLATPPPSPPPKKRKKKDKSINFSHDDDNNYDNQTTFTSRTKYFAHSVESAGSIRQPDRYVATALEKCTIWYIGILLHYPTSEVAILKKCWGKSIFCPQNFDNFVLSFTCLY